MSSMSWHGMAWHQSSHMVHMLDMLANSQAQGVILAPRLRLPCHLQPGRTGYDWHAPCWTTCHHAVPTLK